MTSGLPNRFQIANAEIWNPDGVLKDRDIFVEDNTIIAIEVAGSKSAWDGDGGVVYDARGRAVPSGRSSADI